MLFSSAVESPAQIRRPKDLAVERIVRLEREIEVARREVELFDQLLALHREEDRSNIASNMQLETDGKSRRVRISAGRSTVESKSREAAVASNLTDGAIAKITGASRQAVQKWHTGKMAIPRRHAEKLKARIPMDSWPRLAD